MKGGKPRFTCENCGAEVPLSAKRCPGCGRFFASVRCPSCGFTGDESRFTKGCPVCGFTPAAGKGRPAPPEKTPGGLPFWIYLLSAAIVSGIFALLLFRFA